MRSRKGTSSQPGRLGEVKRSPASVSASPGAPTPTAETLSVATAPPLEGSFSRCDNGLNHPVGALRHRRKALVAGKHLPFSIDEGSQDFRPSEVDPKELRQFMRQLFRKEYAKELEETQLALDAEPGDSMTMTITQTGRMSQPPTAAGTPADTAPRPSALPLAAPPPPPPPEPEKRGFWGSLFKKRK